MKGNVLKPSGMYTENGVYLQTEYKPKTDKPKTDKPRTDRPKTEQTDTMTKIITKARFSNKHRISNTPPQLWPQAKLSRQCLEGSHHSGRLGLESLRRIAPW